MLKQQIQSDVTAALKAGNHNVAGVLRLAVAAINAKEKEKRYKLSKEQSELSEEKLLEQAQLSDDEVISVLSSEIKKRQDAAALYRQGNRPELVSKEEEEIAMIQKYLPEPLPEHELQQLIKDSIAATGAKEMKDMGRVMAQLAPKIKGRADNTKVSQIIKQLLASQ